MTRSIGWNGSTAGSMRTPGRSRISFLTCKEKRSTVFPRWPPGAPGVRLGGMSWVNLRELEDLAKAALPPMVFDYFASGANDEVTLRENRAAYERIALAYRVMAGVGERTMGTTLLGTARPTPVLVAPMAFQRLAHPDGELAVARAASAVGATLVLSTLSTVAMETVVAATTSPVWFQLYLYKDRSQTEALVHRAEAAGMEALVLTVDAPLIGRR